MANNWTAEESALIEREVRRQTMTNQELAERLGRSLQSIAAKKRHVAAQVAAETPAPQTAKPAPQKKQETPKQETPKQEAPKQETPKQESPKQETPKQEAPKQETPKQETPKQETPKQEPPQQETPRAETVRPVQPRPIQPANRDWTPQEDALLMQTPYKSEDELSDTLNRPKEEVHRRRLMLQKQRLEEKERTKRLLIETVTTPLRTDAPEERAPRAVTAAGQTAQLRAMRALISMLGQCAEATEVGAVQDFLAAAEYILAD